MKAVHSATSSITAVGFLLYSTRVTLPDGASWLQSRFVISASCVTCRFSFPWNTNNRRVHSGFFPNQELSAVERQSEKAKSSSSTPLCVPEIGVIDAPRTFGFPYDSGRLAASSEVNKADISNESIALALRPKRRASAMDSISLTLMSSARRQLDFARSAVSLLLNGPSPTDTR